VSDAAARRLARAALVLSVVGLLTGIGLEAGLLHRTSVLGVLGKLTFWPSRSPGCSSPAASRATGSPGSF